MKHSIGIVIPFFNTPMWGQTCVYSLLDSLKKHPELDFQILVVDNSELFPPKSNSIDALKLASDLAQDITILKNPTNMPYHGSALDTAVKQLNTDFLLCWETDMVVFDDNWWNFLLSYINDEKTWAAGYEMADYSGNKDMRDWYLPPNPCIYRMSILKEINKEVEDNLDLTHYWGENYSQSQVVEPHALVNDGSRPFKYGAFSERRGFSSPHPDCPDGKGNLARSVYGHYEPAQWLFYRMLRDPRQLPYKTIPSYRHIEACNGDLAPMYSDFGDGLLKHYWAGTRVWDFFKHEEANPSQITYVQPKIEIEINLWRQIVPLHIRKIVPDVFHSCRNDEFEYNNLRFIYDNKIGTDKSQQLSFDVAEWYKRELLNSNYQNLL